MGKAILEILQQMYGSKFVRDLIGTRTNVVKPKQFDANAPTKSTYSKDAYNDPKLLDTIEEKLIEYAPFQITNRNAREQQNYLENLKKLRDARKKQQGITEQMETVKEVKPEAEIFDIGTKKKVGEEGIMTLKSEVGLPKGVEPGSLADKAIKESAEYKMRQQGVKSLLDEDYKSPKTTTIEEDEAFEFEKFDKDPRRPGGPLDPAVGITRAGARLVLENKGIKIGSKDPLDLVRENFGQDFLNEINNISEEMLEIDRRGGSYRDLTDLLKKEGLYDAPINKDAPKGYSPEEMQKMIDEVEKEKDLGDKLKDYDGDPDGLAEGGRIGFAGGGIKAILALINKKAGKDVVKTADKIDRPESALNREMFGEFNERMSRKTLDVPETPSGFKLSKERLLKNYPEIDETFADEIMTMDRDMQIRIIEMLKDRRKNPTAYDKLLMEKGESMDFQGEFDRSVQRDKNADGGLNYLMGL